MTSGYIGGSKIHQKILNKSSSLKWNNIVQNLVLGPILINTLLRIWLMRWMESLSNMVIVLLCETETILCGTEKKYLERGRTFNNQAFLNGKNNFTVG